MAKFSGEYVYSGEAGGVGKRVRAFCSAADPALRDEWAVFRRFHYIVDVQRYVPACMRAYRRRLTPVPLDGSGVSFLEIDTNSANSATPLHRLCARAMADPTPQQLGCVPLSDLLSVLRPPSSSLSVCARVCSVSATVRRADSSWCVVELAEHDTAVFLVLSGDSFLWAPFLAVNRTYIFTHLKFKKMTVSSCADSKVEQSVLSLTPNLSNIFLFDNDQQVCMKDSSSSPQQHHDVVKDVRACSRATDVVSYRGIVSRHLADGCFELDSHVPLLVGSAVPACVGVGAGIRVGAELCVHNVHAIRDRRGLLALSMCAYSTLEMLSFSRLYAALRPFTRAANHLAHWCLHFILARVAPN